MMSVVSAVSTVSDEQVSWQVRLQESRAFDKVQIAIKKVLQYLLAKTYACPRMARNSERLERPTRVVLKKGGLDIELARCQRPYSCDQTMRKFVCTLELRLLLSLIHI